MPRPTKPWPAPKDPLENNFPFSHPISGPASHQLSPTRNPVPFACMFTFRMPTITASAALSCALTCVPVARPSHRSTSDPPVIGSARFDPCGGVEGLGARQGRYDSIANARLRHSMGWLKACRYKSPLRYRRPESMMTVTMDFPGPSALALCSAAQTLAPEVMPPNTPSRRARSLAVR